MTEGHDDSEVRRLEALGMRGGPVSAARLEVLLGDEDWRVRKQAAESASANLAAPGVLELLASGVLAPDDVGLRNACVEALARAPSDQSARVASALRGALERGPKTTLKFVAAALVGGGDGAVEPLTRLVRDDDVMTAACAVEALAALARRGTDGGAVTAALLETLGRGEPVLRLAALDGLAAIGACVETVTIAPLLADPIMRASALRLLARARAAAEPGGSEVVLALLLGVLPLTGCTVEASLALARRSDPALPPERRAFSEASARAALVTAMGALGAAAISELERAIAERPLPQSRDLARLALEAEELRLLPAIVALGAHAELDPPCLEAMLALGLRAVGPLLELARLWASDDVRGASYALEAASELCARSGDSGRFDASLVALARQLLAGGEEVGARAAASALARLGGPDDAWALAERAAAYGSAFEGVAAQAIEAIASRLPEQARRGIPARVGHRRLSSRGVGDAADLRAQLASDDPVTRAHGLDDAAIERSDQLELVAIALTDEDERVEIAALRALTRVRGPQLTESAVAAVSLATRSEMPTVRAEAIGTLSQLGAFDTRGQLQTLFSALEDPNPRVVIAALRALGTVVAADHRIVSTIERSLAHPDPEIVKEALLAFPREAVVPRALEALSHAHWSVRARAADVLARAAALTSEPDRRLIVERLAERRLGEPDTLVQQAISTALASVPEEGG
jgi:HEAT repeat protein